MANYSYSQRSGCSLNGTSGELMRRGSALAEAAADGGRLMTALWSTSAPSDSEQQRATIGCRRCAFQYGENCTVYAAG